MTIERIKEIAKAFAKQNSKELEEKSGVQLPGMRKAFEDYTEGITTASICAMFAYLSELPMNKIVKELAEFSKDLKANGKAEGICEETE